MAPNDPFLTDEEFRYAAECRRLARLARVTTVSRRGIDIAGYLHALDALGHIWTRYTEQPARRSGMARPARR